MFRSFLFLYGLIFLVLGIFGFIPACLTDQLLWNVFNVNPFLNIIHILAGVCAGLVFFLRKNIIRIYFRCAGIIFIVLALLGFIYDVNPILTIFPSNSANALFHMIMGILGLSAGFGSNAEIP